MYILTYWEYSVLLLKRPLVATPTPHPLEQHPMRHMTFMRLLPEEILSSTLCMHKNCFLLLHRVIVYLGPTVVIFLQFICRIIYYLKTCHLLTLTVSGWTKVSWKWLDCLTIVNTNIAFEERNLFTIETYTKYWRQDHIDTLSHELTAKHLQP